MARTRKRKLGHVKLTHMNDAFVRVIGDCREEGRSIACVTGALHYKKIARKKFEVLENTDQHIHVIARARHLCSMKFHASLSDKVACIDGVNKMANAVRMYLED